MSTPMLAQTAPSRCSARECSAPLHWRRNTATGKNICLDTEPVEKAYVAGYDGPGVPAHHYVIVSATECRKPTDDEWEDDAVPVYESHWRTCKNAGRFNRR